MIVGEVEKAELRKLRFAAAQNPVDVTTLLARLKTHEGKRKHRSQMDRQSIPIPLAFLVTFSIENGHPIGTCRHLSVSSQRAGRVPTREAVWMVAEELGFTGSIEDCQVWLEDLMRGDGPAKAVNIVQPIAVTEGGRA